MRALKHHKGEMMNPVASFGHTSLTDGQLTVFILICYYAVVNGGGERMLRGGEEGYHNGNARVSST